MKETIDIRVTICIEYDKNNPKSREEAIEIALNNATMTETCGHPVSVKPLCATIINNLNKNKKCTKLKEN